MPIWTHTYIYTLAFNAMPMSENSKIMHENILQQHQHICLYTTTYRWYHIHKNFIKVNHQRRKNFPAAKNYDDNNNNNKNNFTCNKKLITIIQLFNTTTYLVHRRFLHMPHTYTYVYYIYTHIYIFLGLCCYYMLTFASALWKNSKISKSEYFL